MGLFPDTLEILIKHFERLPGIGRRSAERCALYILEMPPKDVQGFSQALVNALQRIKPCQRCNNITDRQICSICEDSSRDHSLVCIVEEPKDVFALEKTGKFKGVYHVLLGTIDPLESKGPQSLHLRQLLNRIDKGEIKEVIIATDSDAQGEATAAYLADLFKDKGVLLTRIGLGVPMGADLELVDIFSLSKALENRKPFSPNNQ